MERGIACPVLRSTPFAQPAANQTPRFAEIIVYTIVVTNL